MTDVEMPTRHVQQEIFARILDAWAGHESDTPRPLGKLKTTIEEFSGHPPSLLTLFKGGNDVDLPARGVWRVGPVIDKGSPVLFPVATAAVWEKDNVLNACLRVALIASDDLDRTRVWGWRFDSAEQSTDGSTVPRPHAHSQAITSWSMTGARCLLHPHNPRDTGDRCPWDTSVRALPPVNETHPAFPLLGRTLPGLALAFVVSLHGVSVAREIIDSDLKITKTAGQVINDDLKAILGAA
jgi:hypothetical protein